MKRKGSGRTKGAGSFVAVQWGDLEKVLKPDATVIVSRRYAEQLQLNCKAFKATTENIQSVAQQIQFAEAEMTTQAVPPKDDDICLTSGMTHKEAMNEALKDCDFMKEEEDNNSQIQISELNW